MASLQIRVGPDSAAWEGGDETRVHIALDEKRAACGLTTYAGAWGTLRPGTADEVTCAGCRATIGTQ